MISPLYSTAIYPKPNHTPYGVLINETKNGYIGYTFALIPFFVFLFLLFQVRALDPSFGHLYHHECHLAPPHGFGSP